MKHGVSSVGTSSVTLYLSDLSRECIPYSLHINCLFLFLYVTFKYYLIISSIGFILCFELAVNGLMKWSCNRCSFRNSRVAEYTQ